MKIIFSAFIFAILFSDLAFCQLEYYVPQDRLSQPVELNNNHFPGEIQVSLSPNIITGPDFNTKFAGGIKFQVFLGKRLSVDADLVAGMNYIHGGPGIIAIPFWLLSLGQFGMESDNGGSFRSFLFILAASILSFEHLSYHIPLKNELEISPYISILRFRQFTLTEDDYSNGGQLSFATGVGIDKYFGRFFISPYIEYNIGYNDGISAFNAGTAFGLSFPRK